MHYSFDTRPERPGYRLHRLELFNWGTFDSTDGQVYRFEPQGRTALLVGHNGSGKSTLVDAVLTLLVEPRTRNYNVAAGARKTERTEKSYIRGAYARTSDDANAAIVKYLRPHGSNLTALSAVFTDEQLGKSFTLCQVLHLTADSSTEKLFAIIDEARELKDDLAGVRQADEISSQLQRLGYDTTRKFVQYRSWLTRRTKMLPKAMDMFNQTVAVKDIQSLNDFIRRHMLEPHDWREKVSRLLTHFHDLSVAHQELVRARKAVELLEPVEIQGVKYREQSDRMAAHEGQLRAAELFFREQTVALLEPTTVARQLKYDALADDVARIKRDQQSLAERIRQIRNEIDQVGGDRLRAIPGLIELEQGKLALKRQGFERFHSQLKRCGIHDVIGSAQALAEAHGRLKSTASQIQQKLTSAHAEYEELVAKRGEFRQSLREDEYELQALGDRTTNLPPRLALLRKQLCEDLQLPEERVPFAAELMRVNPDERRWEASTEMVLRPLALSLLVPEPYYQRVRAYIDRTKLVDQRGQGQRLDYLLVGRGADVTGDRIDPQSLVRKLQFRDRHPLVPWLRGEVARRFNYRCCESVDEFNQTSRQAMTESRHVKYGAERHTKDDRARTVDPRHFVLGWDNRQKKQLIAKRVESLKSEISDLDCVVFEKTSELDNYRGILDAATEALTTTSFDAIDVRRHQEEIAALENERAQLESSNSVVKVLKNRLAEAERGARELDDARDEANKQLALIKKDIADGKQLVAKARSRLAEAKLAGDYDQHASMFAAISESLGDGLSAENLFEREGQWTSSTHKTIENLRGPLQRLGERLVESMSRFLRDFKEEQVDLNASVHSLDSFLGLLAQLREEDLPRHEKKFKDRLNDKVTQEVALFHTALREERRQIEGKIEQLNKALAELEYRPGTYMELQPRPVQDREIEEFRRSLRECLDDSFDSSPEANEARFLRIERLVARLADSEKTRWRDKVIDVRNWYSFAAREFDKATGETRSFHEGSTGQSGGEKAKLAFTILVAAIAYQYDIDPTGGTPGRFQFVVVDEMFSKIDDQNAAYALRLFEQFGLQLLIVAPLDAKARVTEPFVDSYLQVVKDDLTGRSQLFSMTAREYEEVVQQFTGNGSSAARRVTAK